MLILFHVSVALGGIISAALSVLKPSKVSFKFTYSLVGLTSASGTALVITAHANLVQTCVSGLLYLGFIFIAIAVARRRLATELTKT
jgi:hypothetical protein